MLALALHEMFGVQLYKNNARALLSRILSILYLDWLQHARSVRGVYEYNIAYLLYHIHVSHTLWHEVLKKAHIYIKFEVELSEHNKVSYQGSFQKLTAIWSHYDFLFFFFFFNLIFWPNTNRLFLCFYDCLDLFRMKTSEFVCFCFVFVFVFVFVCLFVCFLFLFLFFVFVFLFFVLFFFVCLLLLVLLLFFCFVLFFFFDV